MSLAHLLGAFFPTWGSAATNEAPPSGMVPFGSPIFTPSGLDELSRRYCEENGLNPKEWAISSLGLRTETVGRPNIIRIAAVIEVRQRKGLGSSSCWRFVLERKTDSTAHYVFHHDSETKNLLGSIAGALRWPEDRNRTLLKIEVVVGGLRVLACPYFKSNLGTLKLPNVSDVLARTLYGIVIGKSIDNTQDAAPVSRTLLGDTVHQPCLAETAPAPSSSTAVAVEEVSQAKPAYIGKYYPTERVEISQSKSVPAAALDAALQETLEGALEAAIAATKPTPPVAELVEYYCIFTLDEMEELRKTLMVDYIERIQLVSKCNSNKKLTLAFVIRYRQNNDQYEHRYQVLVAGTQTNEWLNRNNEGDNVDYGTAGDRILQWTAIKMSEQSSPERVLLKIDSTGMTTICPHLKQAFDELDLYSMPQRGFASVITRVVNRIAAPDVPEFIKLVESGEISLLDVAQAVHKSGERGRLLARKLLGEGTVKPQPQPVKLVPCSPLYTVGELAQWDEDFNGEYTDCEIHKIQLVMYTSSVAGDFTLGVACNLCYEGDGSGSSKRHRHWQQLLAYVNGKVEIRPKGTSYGVGDKVLNLIGEACASVPLLHRRVVLSMDSLGNTDICPRLKQAFDAAGMLYQHLPIDIISPILRAFAVNDPKPVPERPSDGYDLPAAEVNPQSVVAREMSEECMLHLPGDNPAYPHRAQPVMKAGGIVDQEDARFRAAIAQALSFDPEAASYPPQPLDKVISGLDTGYPYIPAIEPVLYHPCLTAALSSSKALMDAPCEIKAVEIPAEVKEIVEPLTHRVETHAEGDLQARQTPSLNELANAGGHINLDLVHSEEEVTDKNWNDLMIQMLKAPNTESPNSCQINPLLGLLAGLPVETILGLPNILTAADRANISKQLLLTKGWELSLVGQWRYDKRAQLSIMIDCERGCFSTPLAIELPSSPDSKWAERITEAQIEEGCLIKANTYSATDVEIAKALLKLVRTKVEGWLDHHRLRSIYLWMGDSKGGDYTIPAVNEALASFSVEDRRKALHNFVVDRAMCRALTSSVWEKW